jgi:hypothetical protein
MMILELATRGDLKAVLREARPSVNTPATLTIEQRLKMCIDVANGMRFLGSLEFIHRDLACRCGVVLVYCCC